MCRARGIHPLQLSNIRPLYLPTLLIVPVIKKVYQREETRLVFEGHAAHAADEMRAIYHDVLAEGERLGVEMPHFRGFQAYVDRVAAPEAILEKKPVL